MKEFTIAKNDAGQRLDRWLAKTLPLLPAPLAQKYIRLKRVKVNGKGSKRDVRLQVGDVLQLYINDEFFDRPTPENAFLSLYQPKLNILYEDEHVLLLDKRPGLVVHPDETERVNTLLTHIQSYLYQKKEWSPYKENSFAPALCNRIDRNTGGIVIAAKTAEALRVMNQKIKDRELSKFYLCAVLGRMEPREGKLEGFIWKDEVKKQVYVRSRPQPGAKTAITFWHGMGGELGEITDDLIKEFNASQDQYEVKGVYKGNYDEAIIRPFNKAVEEIESISNGSIHMDFDYDDINTFLAGRMNVGIDQTLWDYIQKLDKTRAAKQLKGKTSHKKAPKAED